MPNFMTCGVLVSLQSDEEKLLLLFITPQDLMTSTLISLSLSLFRKALPKKSANRRKELVAQLLPLLLLLEEAFVSFVVVVVVVVVAAAVENFASVDSVVDVDVVGNLLFGILHHPCVAFLRIARLCAFVVRIASSGSGTEHQGPCHTPSSCSSAPFAPGSS
jgi:uncharacterized membrane protein